MTGQSLDLLTFLRLVRQQLLVAIAIAAAGLIAGLTFTLIHPPLYASEALVLLPSPASGPAGTQHVIAASSVVLTGAVGQVRPAVTAQELHAMVTIRGLSPSVIQIAAKGTSAMQAQTAANAIARSYVRYLGQVNSAVGLVPAEVLARSTPGVVASFRNRLIITGVVGVLAGTLMGAVVAAAIGRSRTGLRERDDIADATGAPVLASLPVMRARGVKGWNRLLDRYEPSDVHAARIKNVLRRVGLDEMTPRGPGDDAGHSLLILSLSSDPRALAFGPQLARFRAASGLSTLLAIGTRPEGRQAASLWAACSAAPQASSMRPGCLRITALSGDPRTYAADVAMTVAIGVLNVRAPQLHDLVRASATLLVISAGAATGDLLSRMAALITADGRRLAGVIVVDPDRYDCSTGRTPRPAGIRRRARPTRMAWTTTEIWQ